MKWTFENAKIKGRIVLTDSLHEDPDLLKDKTLYKFIWVDSGEVELDIDHQHVVLKKEQLVPLSHLHHLEFLRIEGKCYALMFNGNFYCIHGNDHEVSCNGLLFHGSSHVLTFVLSEDERRKIDTLTRIMQEEFLSTDHLFETIRKFYVLVDTYFKEKKQVQEYADMLNKSPKTLANILSAYQQPSAIRIIHNRIQAEARRLLLYTAKSSKEIALMLGFEDQAAFSRFFKNAAGLSATEYRHQYKK